MNTYAEATAAELLEAIPFYEAIECDMAAAAIAFMRWTRHGGEDFKVKGLPFPKSNFSSIHLILAPLVREDAGRKTLAPFAAYLRLHEITAIRVVGSGMFNRHHQYLRAGRGWGNMPTTQKPAPPAAPTQHIDVAIPAAPEADDAPLWPDPDDWTVKT